MKKRAESDLDAECNFSGLPPHEIETACKYEYMRESKGLRGLHNSAAPSIAPHLSKLSRSCKPDCPRQYRLQQNKEEPKQYRFHCSHCDQAVNVPLITIVRWKRQLEKEHRLSARRVRPSFADEFGWDATLRLVLALRTAGFPKPWKLLIKDARQGLIEAITGWDNDRKRVYPPVAIEPALERDLESEQEQGARFSIWRIKSFESELRRLQQLRRNCFYGLIRIDEAYNEGDAVEAFKNEFRKRWPQIRSGGGGWREWQAKLNDLVVMRLRKRFPGKRNQIRRVQHVAELTTAGFAGCKAFRDNRQTAKREKREVEQRMSKAAIEEMSRACGDALKFFQTYFPGEIPLNY